MLFKESFDGAIMENLTAWAETRYGVINYFKSDSVIGASLREYGEWAQNELEILLHFVSPDSLVVDVGANVGAYTLAFARKAHSGGRVISFEPQPEVADLLKKTIARNGLSNVDVIEEGLSDTISTLYFSPPDYNSNINVGAVKLVAGSENEEFGVKVSVTTLDSYSLERCDFLKIDSEGMGVQVLAGAKETVARCRPVISLEADNVEETELLFTFLSAENYKVIFFECAAYKQDNFLRVSNNFFGVASEGLILAFPSEINTGDMSVIDRGCIVESSEHLAQLVLEIPRYGDATPYERKSMIGLRRMLAKAIERENKTISYQEELKRLNEQYAEEILRLKYRTMLLDERVEHLENIKRRVDHLESIRGGMIPLKDLQAVYNSTSWRITAPMRKIKRMLGRD